ncbi:hypothetical protein [Polaribacter sp. IC066]|nr:hypothetical protein [Polaribacter sp. IC066]
MDERRWSKDDGRKMMDERRWTKDDGRLTKIDKQQIFLFVTQLN